MERGLDETSHQHTENVFMTNTCRRATTDQKRPVNIFAYMTGISL